MYCLSKELLKCKELKVISSGNQYSKAVGKDMVST